jgi:predicted NBD/HSP70 family sugar kinase
MKRSLRDIRLANRFDVLRQVIASRAVSRQQIVAETGLSLATVSTLVGELLDLGLLEEVGYEGSGGGRPRGLLAVTSGRGVLIGVDVAESYVHVEMFNPKLAALARTEAPLDPDGNSPDHVARQIAAAVRSVLDQAAGDAGTPPQESPSAQVLGVGVSVPGQVGRDGTVSISAPNWDWQDVPLRRLLGQQLHLPIYLDNPLRASTVAELWFGAGRGRRDVVVLTLGTGVGAGLALGGSLYRGATNSAGEWGHTTLVLDGRPCRCGSRGCVEAYVGAPGIVQHLRELAPDSPLLRSGGSTETVEALARAAAGGDQVATRVVAETARYLGMAVAGLVNLVNPQVVVLSGWVAAKLGSALLDAVRGVVERHAPRRPCVRAEIVLCPIAGNPVSLGAATLALEGFLTAIGRRL